MKEKATCIICGNTYRGRRDLAGHFRASHPSPDPNYIYDEHTITTEEDTYRYDNRYNGDIKMRDKDAHNITVKNHTDFRYPGFPFINT